MRGRLTTGNQRRELRKVRADERRQTFAVAMPCGRVSDEKGSGDGGCVQSGRARRVERRWLSWILGVLTTRRGLICKFSLSETRSSFYVNR